MNFPAKHNKAEFGKSNPMISLDLKVFTFFFAMTSVLSMALTPQFYGYLLPAIFIIPVISGLIGIRKRSFNAMLFSLTIIPLALTSGMTWIKYYVTVAHPAFYEFVAESALRWRVTFTIARLLIIVPSLLGFLLVLFSLITAYLSYRYRKMFI